MDSKVDHRLIQQGDRLVPRAEAARQLGLSALTLYRRERAGTPGWPEVVHLGSRRVFYRASDLQRLVSSGFGPANTKGEQA